jgi:hypothetical protein
MLARFRDVAEPGRRYGLSVTVDFAPPLSGLTEILMRVVELAQDRRKTRYIRARRAMEQRAEALKTVKAPRKPSADDEH